MSLFVEQNLGVFLILTIVFGGGAAFLAGRGLAMKWRPVWSAIIAMVPLALGVRFLHYALFQEELTSLHYLATDFLILAAACYAGHRLTMAKKMVRQYPWLYEQTGLFSWRERG